MSRGLSIYLDLLRFLAALEVAAYHLGLSPSGGLGRSTLTAWGHEAVVVFFVLSGFVVNHAARTRDATCLDFAASRISRIYSVILPCIVVTMVCDVIGLTIAPAAYDAIHIDDGWRDPVVRMFISALLLNNSWVPVQLFSNVPYWSVCYEFWYYFLFASAFYFQGRQRWMLCALFAFMAGPRALIEFPIWLMGAWVYTQSTTRVWSKAFTWLVFLQPLAVLAIYAHYDLSAWGFGITTGLIDGKWLDNGCAYVLTDTLLGVSFALHLLAATRLDQTFERLLGWAEGVIRIGAARSFTLYLFHQPIMFMLTAIMTLVSDGAWVAWPISLGTIVLPLLVGGVIEGQRHPLRPLVMQTLIYWVPMLNPKGPMRVPGEPGLGGLW